MKGYRAISRTTLRDPWCLWCLHGCRYNGTLALELANVHPNNRILRRKVAWLLGQWVSKVHHRKSRLLEATGIPFRMVHQWAVTAPEALVYHSEWYPVTAPQDLRGCHCLGTFTCGLAAGLMGQARYRMPMVYQ